MITPKVSVIIPVYNTERYLGESVGSVINQTLRDIEILIVDDGSDDGSLLTLKKISEGDSRVKIYTQQNSGQSIARNTALNHAEGEYLYFMDSDDILDLGALEICYNRAKQESLDLILFDADVFTEDNLKISGYDYNRKGYIDNKKIYTGEEILKLLTFSGLFRAAPWIHFVKRSLVEENRLRFYPGIIHEDELYLPQLYLNSLNVGYIAEIFFHRRVRRDSTMTRVFSEKNVRCYLIVVDELQSLKRGKSESVSETLDELIRIILDAVAYQSGALKIKSRAEILYRFIKMGYLKYISIKSLTVLIMPMTITVKSKIIKPLIRKIRL
jgi:glycosyltransferase involved in cell wall biosynthesis